MKLKNKKTGEIVNAMEVDLYTDAVYLKISKDGRYDSIEYNSLAELNEEWEDYEESKEAFQITSPLDEDDRSVLIEFPTHEDANKATEKFKAWKRLKDKGFEFKGGDEACISYMVDLDKWDDEAEEDFKLLFGGEE